jgi:hypothetical protein
MPSQTQIIKIPAQNPAQKHLTSKSLFNNFMESCRLAGDEGDYP